MLKLRLQRVGKKNIPSFRIVLTDSKNSTKSGRFLEVLGTYDTINNVKTVDGDRVKHWISVGAQPTETLHNFLVDQKVISGKKVNVLPRKSPIKKEGDAPPASTTPAVEVASPENASSAEPEKVSETPAV